MKIIGKFFSFFILVIIISVLIFFTFNIELAKNVQGSADYHFNPTFIIDAGHGGIDGGALGVDGTYEKDINLEISLKLNELLKSYGFNTVMIRDSDCSVHSNHAKTVREIKVSDIHNRMSVMENTDNCIFISIHQNSYNSSKYWGTQVFYSPNTPESKDLAGEIQQSVVSLLQKDNTRQIKECGKSVYLLYYAKKPAVLVECGFITNYNDLELLKSEEYQRKMAFCIADGILNYVNKGS